MVYLEDMICGEKYAIESDNVGQLVFEKTENVQKNTNSLTHVMVIYDAVLRGNGIEGECVGP